MWNWERRNKRDEEKMTKREAVTISGLKEGRKGWRKERIMREYTEQDKCSEEKKGEKNAVEKYQ